MRVTRVAGEEERTREGVLNWLVFTVKQGFRSALLYSKCAFQKLAFPGILSLNVGTCFSV